MRVKVLEERIYDVPELLVSEVRGAIELKDSEYLDELLGDLESHCCCDSVKTVSCVEVKE